MATHRAPLHESVRQHPFPRLVRDGNRDAGEGLAAASVVHPLGLLPRFGRPVTLQHFLVRDALALWQGHHPRLVLQQAESLGGEVYPHALLLQPVEDDAVHAAEAPYRFEGEVRVLMDARTGSAAELFAAALQDVMGAKLIGRATAGSTRGRRTARLPGGVSLHYAGRAEFQRRNGDRVEGVGVVPDIHFLPTREQLAGGDFGNSAADPAVRHAQNLPTR